MGRSSNKRGPDFRVLRPDLESSRTACDKPVQHDEWDRDEEVEIPAEVEDESNDQPKVAWADPELSR